MKALLFVIRRTLKNLIKGVFKKPILLIGYIFIILFIVLMLVASFAMPSGFIRSGSPGFFTGIMSLVFIFMYYTTLKLGIEKGSTYFRLADVNFAFTAPIMPNKILLYAFIKQVGGTFLFLFIAICQIPNLKNNFALQPYGTWMILLSVIMYTLSYPLISMILYSWATKSSGRKNLLKRLFDILALAVAVLFIFSLAKTRSFADSLDEVFNNPVARYFPVIGWTSSIASAAMNGFTPEFWVGAMGMVLLIAGASVVLYRMNLDYYEDVLEGAEYVEAALKAKREGNNLRFNLKIKNKVNQKLSGTGASSIFFKNLLELRKTAFFMFLDRSSVMVIIAAIVFKFIMPSEASELTLSTILFFAAYMLLLIQMQGGIGKEIEKHYIFLIPASSAEKLFFVTLGEHVKNLFDGFILFTAAGILFKAPVNIVAGCTITYGFFGAVYTYGDIIARRIFGRIHSKGVLIFVKAIVNLLMVLPGIIGGAIVFAITRSEFLMISIIGGWGFVLATTLFVFSAGILNNLETVS